MEKLACSGQSAKWPRLLLDTTACSVRQQRYSSRKSCHLLGHLSWLIVCVFTGADRKLHQCLRIWPDMWTVAADVGRLFLMSCTSLMAPSAMVTPRPTKGASKANAGWIIPHARYPFSNWSMSRILDNLPTHTFNFFVLLTLFKVEINYLHFIRFGAFRPYWCAFMRYEHRNQFKWIELEDESLNVEVVKIFLL